MTHDVSRGTSGALVRAPQWQPLNLGELADVAEVTAVGLRYTRELTYDEWAEHLQTLTRVGEAVQWWIGDSIRYGEHRWGEQYTQAIEATGYQYQTLANMVFVAGSVEPSRRRETLSFSHHAEVAGLEPEEQDNMLTAAESHEWSVRDTRRAVRTYRQQRARSDPGGVPQGDVYLADPPWDYDVSVSESRSIEAHYPTMTLEEIMAIGADLEGEDAILLLWSPAPLLPEALQVMSAWGFDYRTGAVWDKVRIGMGYWFRGRHEHLLLGVRGDVSPPDPEHRHESIFQETRGEHSVKPTSVHEWVEAAFPRGRWVELFARRERPGWEAWGDEL